MFFSSKVGFNMTPQEDTPLVEVLQMGLEKYVDELGQISGQASKEYALEKVKDISEMMASGWCSVVLCLILIFQTNNTSGLLKIKEDNFF